MQARVDPQLLLLSRASHFPLGQLVVRMMLMRSPLLTGRSCLRPLVVTVTVAWYMASSWPVICSGKAQKHKTKNTDFWFFFRGKK